MGQLRSAVRALAIADAAPAAVLSRLDRFVDGVPAAEVATLGYAVLDLADGDLRYACAGHPPPVLVGPDGVPRLLGDGRSVPLGAFVDPVERPEGRARLRPGASLALYSDGLVERRREDLDEGIERLARAVADTTSTYPGPALADRVTDSVLRSTPTEDDACLLVATYLGTSAPRP
jgi:serine phosphatase RsbU (regulator of sigma subunit)